ncbi:MAG TPA: helix-turn-helix domain-containing protein [Nitrososphaeraceae archaeon]|nr:helix-turn-helix domain-containing protein [Nitrososphaeraceae archaeon]
MGIHLPENTRQTVIRLWLEGKSRKHIALISGVSEGTVSNIIDEWRQKLGDGDAEALRELAINMKRIGIDAVQCAQGYRISSIMRKLGINENQFKFFINEVYEYCQRFGLTAENIASNLLAVIKLSKDIPFSKIPGYIEEKKNEKRQLEEDIKTLKENKEALEMEISAAKDLRDAALENERITTAEIREYSNLKAELRRYGLTIEEDIPKFVQVIHGIKRYEYDVDKVLSDYSDEQIKQIKLGRLSDQVKRLEDTKIKLQSECSFLNEQVDLHRQMLYVYQELKSMGLGLRELKIIYNTIKETASENNIIDYREAVNKFFEFLEQRYDVKLRLRLLEEKQQQKEYNNTKHDKPDQRQVPSPSSISCTYRKTTTALPKTTKEEQDNQLNNNYHSDE